MVRGAASANDASWIDASLEQMLNPQGISDYLQKNKLRTPQRTNVPITYWREHRHELMQQINFAQKDGDIITQALQLITAGVRAQGQ
jgi:hypothetical protein